MATLRALSRHRPRASPTPALWEQESTRLTWAVGQTARNSVEGCRAMEADLRNSISVVNFEMEEVLVGRIGRGGVSCNFLGAGDNITQPVPLGTKYSQLYSPVT